MLNDQPNQTLRVSPPPSIVTSHDFALGMAIGPKPSGHPQKIPMMGR